MQSQNIQLIDANVIIRYLIGDGAELAQKAKEIMQKVSDQTQKVFIKEVVVAEVIFVLEGVYKIPKDRAVFALSQIISTKSVKTENKTALLFALDFYANNSIDFVDSLLIAYNQQEQISVISFDKKLNKFLS